MKTQCPNCKSRFNVNETNVGKQAKCPKCTKPFTIEPFVETSAAVAAPTKVPEPAVPVKTHEPAAPPVKIPEPVVPPVKSPAPVEAPAKKAEPVESTVKAAVLAEPAFKSPAPIKPQAKVAEPAKQEKQESKAASKGLSKIVFVYCWAAVRIVAAVLAVFGVMLLTRKGDRSTLTTYFIGADVFLVLSVLIELMLFYKMCAAIQDRQTSMSPAKAVGFLFIPVFNIYWSLYMLMGFAEDYNAFIQRYSVKAKELPVMLYLIFAFFFLLVAIFITTPMICVFGFFGRVSSIFISHSDFAWSFLCFVIAIGVGHFITYILVAMKTCNAINALPGASAGKS